MAEVVAEGEIILRAKENVRAELAKAEAAFDRTMERLDGQEAVLDLKINDLEFKRKSKEAEEEIKKLRHEREVKITLGADTKQLDAAIAKEEKNLNKLMLKNQQLENQRSKLLHDRQTAENKYYADSEKAEKKYADTVDRESKRAADSAKKAQDDVTKSHDAAVRGRVKAAVEEADAKIREDKRTADAAAKNQNFINKANSRAVNLRIRDALREANERDKISAQSTRLERQYIDLVQRRQRLTRAGSRVFLPESDRVKINFDIKGVNEQIAEIEAKLALIGKPPPEIKLHIDADTRGADSLNRWIAAISSTTVRLGPFTTTIAGAVRGLALLGPVITGVVGALGALVGAVGSAALGFGGALTAGVGAFGLVLGSTAALLPGLLTDFKTLTQLQDAYHKAVLKSGKGSDEAKKAHQQLDRALKQVSPTTRQAIAGYGKLQDQYQKLADKARVPFTEALNEGIKTGSTLMNRFGGEALQSFGLVAKGAKTVARALRSPEATNIIGTLFDNGQKALPAFAKGLGNLAVSAARVGAAFSRMLPSLGDGFEKFTERFTKFTSNSGKLNHFVDETTKSMRSLGKVASATGDFLAAFFGQGVKSGVGLMDRLAGGINKITDNIKSNPKGLSDFFGQSVDTAERLYHVLAPLASLFMEWATILRPFSNLILSVSASISGLVASLSEFGPTRAIITTAFAVFLAGTLVSKIRSVTGAIQTLAASLTALGGKQAALRVGSSLTGGLIPSLGNGAATSAREVQAAEGAMVARNVASSRSSSSSRGTVSYAGLGGAGKAATVEKEAAGAAKLAGGLSKGAKAAGALRLGLAGVGAVLGGGEILGAAAVAAIALGGAYYLLHKRAGQAAKDLADTHDATQRSTDAYHANSSALADTNSNLLRANLTVRQARRDLKDAKKGTDEYKLAQLNLSDAERARVVAQKQVRDNQKESNRLADEAVARAQKEIVAQGKLDDKKLKAAQDSLKLSRVGKSANAPFNDQEIGLQKEISDLTAQRAKRTEALTKALNIQGAAQANNARGMKGFVPLVGQAEQKLGEFARTADKASAKKIAVKFQDSGDAGKVAAAASAAIKRGVPAKVATRVAVSTGDAEAAIKRLDNYKITKKELKIVQKGGPEAIATVQKLAGVKLTTKQQEIIEKGGDKALQTLAHLLGINLKPKEQNITEKGSGPTLDSLGRISGFKLNDKSFKATAIDAASSIISAIIRGINSIPNTKTSTITTIYQDIHKSDRTSGGHFASGGVFAAASGAIYQSPALQRTVGAAYKSLLNNSAARKSQGERVNKPKLLVGEQRGKPEYVIATNPAYRKRNQKLLASAAKRLGMNVTSAATGAIPGGGTFSSKGGGYTADLSAPSTKKIPKALDAKTLKRSSKIKSKKKYAYKTNRSWATYITNLHTRQDQLEREVSIREGEVREPEDMVVQTGTQSVKDKNTGEVTDVPIYAANPKIESEYKPDLSAVLQAVAALKAVVSALVSGIPQAVTANQTEQSYRNSAAKTLHTEIAKENKRTGLKGDAKTKHDNRLSKLKDAYSHEEDVLKDLKADEKTLLSDRVEAGFDFREVEDSRASYQREYDTASGNAATEATKESADAVSGANGSGSSGGSGGSGSDTATLAQQTGLADTERASILKTFGGNAAALVSTGVANFAMGGGGTRNAGSLSPNVGAGLSDSLSGGASAAAAGSGGAGGSKSVAAALASGSQAAGVMSGGSATGAAATGAAVAAGGGTVTNITNNFAAPPADPHTWTAGVAFEASALL